MSYLIGLGQGGHHWGVQAIWLSNIGLITAYACLWTSFRVFAGKAPVWICVCAGGVIWACLCLWPVFMGSVYFRIAMFSLLAIGYTVLCCRALMPNLRKDRWVSLFLLAILVLHGVFYVMRLVPWPASGITWLARPDFGPTVFENMLVVISLAYGVLIMVSNRTLHRYRGALQARRDLLGYISHDLRSPLTGMLDSVRLWRKGDNRRDHALVIERYAQQQMDLIDELLDYTRSELSDLEVSPVPGYLHAFLQGVTEQAELLAAQRHNRFEVRLADDLPGRVQADFHHLRRVLFNLLGNAAKFTGHGCIRLAVQVHPALTAGRVGLHFIVDDDGPGIAPADRERLLLPYARGELAKDHEGFGLGLAIVGSLLERMGSKLAIDGSPDGGSRFHFVIELEPATEADMEPMADAGESLDIDGRGQVVLVVDDDRQLRELASDLLDGYGFDTVTAAGVAGAVDILRARNVAVVVTDQYMDGMDGWDLLRRIREDHPALPVVLYSAMPPQRPAGMAATLDFDAAVLKPADDATLVRLVVSALKASRLSVVASDDLVS